MLRFFKSKASSSESTSEQLDSLLERDSAYLRSADPETNLQWLRLRRTLATQPTAAPQGRTRLIPRLAFAATLVAAVAVGAYFYFTPRETSSETFATQKGEQTRLVLQDSSEVTLNYATELIVPKMHRDKARYLSLKGEAFFRVRRNATPFIVSTELGNVQVVGTEFNVRMRNEMLEVAVIHGIVKVNRNATTLTLTQGQRAICAQGGIPRLIDNVPSAEYPGWMNGKLFFDGVTFAGACREIEMRFDVVIRIDDAKVQNEIVTGMLNARDAESALSALCGLTGKKFRQDGKVYSIH